MSKKLFSFLINELSFVRLLCKQAKCGAAIELPLTKLGKPIRCPSCGNEFDSSTSDGQHDSPLNMLGQAVRALADDKELDVEFVLPVKE